MSCNLEPCSVYTDFNAFEDTEMSEIGQWSAGKGGANLSIVDGYLGGDAILISGRSAAWNGIGQIVQG